MAFDLAHIETVLAGGVAVPGTPALPQTAFALEEAICAARADLLYMWAQPGRRPLGAAGDPIADHDGLDDRKYYVLPAASATTTRVDPTTAKLGYWKCNRAAAGHVAEGMAMTAPALGDLKNAPGYTFLTLFRPGDVTAANCILGQGTPASSRLALYQNENAQLGIQHGGSNVPGPNSIAPVGVWSAALYSYRASDREAKLFANSVTATDTLTMPVVVPTLSPNFRIGHCADNSLTFTAKADIALIVGWLGYLPDTPGACESIMNAAMAMRALCPQ